MPQRSNQPSISPLICTTVAPVVLSFVTPARSTSGPCPSSGFTQHREHAISVYLALECDQLVCGGGLRRANELTMEKAAPVFGQYVSAANCKWRARADIYMAGLVSCRLLCRAGSQKGSAPGHLPEYRTETESHRDYTGPVPQGPVRAAIHKPRPEGGCCRAQGASCA